MAYSDIKDPSAHFHTQIWTGGGTLSPRSITNNANSGDFQPDFVWTKGRATAYEHQLYDSSRGAGTTKGLDSSGTAAEGNVSATYGYLSSFDSNGFTGTAGTSGQNAYYNVSGQTYVAWQWKANGGTTSSNTDGSITSTVQANQVAGFSIVTWAGTASAATIGHGLGVAPKFIIVRARDKDVPTSWAVFHKDGSTSDDDVFVLQTTGAKATYAGFWNNQYPSSTVFGVANDFWVNSASTNYLAYCFAEKQGYSKFGKYIGNGNVNGPMVYLGFKPAMIILKRSDSTTGGNWHIIDNKRSASGGANVNVYSLFPNLNAAESTGEAASTYGIDFLSNGFKIRASHSTRNTSGGTYIYMAFAENPFVAGGIPTTAR